MQCHRTVDILQKDYTANDLGVVWSVAPTLGITHFLQFIESSKCFAAIGNKLVHSFTHLLSAHPHVWDWDLLLSCTWLWRIVSLICHIKVNYTLFHPPTSELLSSSGRLGLKILDPLLNCTDFPSGWHQIKLWKCQNLLSFQECSPWWTWRCFSSYAKQTILRTPEREREEFANLLFTWSPCTLGWFRPLETPKNTMKTPRIVTKRLKFVLTAKIGN